MNQNLDSSPDKCNGNIQECHDKKLSEDMIIKQAISFQNNSFKKRNLKLKLKQITSF
jgi:hypothetical protein